MDLVGTFSNTLGRLFYSIALGVGWFTLSGVFGPQLVYEETSSSPYLQNLLGIDPQLFLLGVVFFAFLTGEIISLIGALIYEEFGVGPSRRKIQNMALENDSDLALAIFARFSSRHDVAIGFIGLGLFLLAGITKYIRVDFDAWEAVELILVAALIFFAGAYSARSAAKEALHSFGGAREE